MKNQNFLQALKIAVSGICQAFASERNLRIDAIFAPITLLLCLLLRLQTFEFICVIICIGFVTAFEIMNTALEAVVDLVSPEFHPLAKRAKDCAAGATLIAGFVALIVGIIIFCPKILALCGI